MLLCHLHICVPELTSAKERILSAFYGTILAKQYKINEDYHRFLVDVFGFSRTCRVDGGLPFSRCRCPVTGLFQVMFEFLQRLNKLQCGVSPLLSSAHFHHLLRASSSTPWQCNNLHHKVDLTKSSFFWVNLWLKQFPNIVNCRATDLLKSIPGRQKE